jgi:hypothetical protein
MRATSECQKTGSSDKLTGNRSRRAGLKKGADEAVGERKTGRKNEEQDRRKTLQEQPSRKRTGDAPLGYSGRTALRREQCDMDGATGGGGRVNSVDSQGDVTYPHSFHQYTMLGKHSLPPAVT